jgi:hypothetical protein
MYEFFTHPPGEFFIHPRMKFSPTPISPVTGRQFLDEVSFRLAEIMVTEHIDIVKLVIVGISSMDLLNLNHLVLGHLLQICRHGILVNLKVLSQFAS